MPNDNLFERLGEVIEALNDAKTDDERRIYTRTALRTLSHVLGKAKECVDAMKATVR
jgi:hypothetical protein